MSKKLTKAILLGNVTVRNVTSGEVLVWIHTAEGVRRSLIVAPNSRREISPRHTPAVLLKKGTNLPTLLRRSLRIV